ncbi:hypothetical protein CPB84DRAFT_1851418 [Gymnopilus junonius]|uniref:Uncharacterized protein n=1 Tax=Gymnopilus junonius TaxID=109634 RepID=A0A9P5NES6_GYMJU|nr:hypothetical protein CPB84DRAFT_1851418 [Gymnopilus junonius]
MDRSSSPEAAANPSLNALATLLGVKGRLRLVPQGPTPKPHVVIKRDFPKGNDDLDDLAPGVARFSFIAGKKFSANKGQPLFFAVASPTDRDGKTLLSEENTFLIEADLADVHGENDEEHEEEEGHHRGLKRKRIEIESLPPKMRKSYTRKKTYQSFIRGEPSSSLGFVGYPLGASTSRVYSSAAVQTDVIQTTVPISLKSITAPSDLTSTPVHEEKSPMQLPSPVSADHTLEPNSEDLAPLEGEETDAFSREERSLSPMELSSAAGSASCSPAFKELPLLEEQRIIPVFDTQPNERLSTPPLDVPPQIPPASSEASQNPTPPVEAEILHLPRKVPPPEVQPISPPRSLSPPAAPPSPPHQGPPPQEDDSSDSLEAKKLSEASPQRCLSPPPRATPQENDSSKAKERSGIVEVATKQPAPTQDLSVKKELVVEAEKPLAVHNPNVTSTPVAKPTPIMPRAMRGTPYMSDRAKGKASAPAPGQDYLPTPISMRTSTSAHQFRSSSPPPDPKQLVYISSVSSSNPLGIRPSHVHQKAAPTAPRSLLSSTSTTSAPKKPLVVGAKWSAARNSGSSSNAAPSSSNNNGSLSASTSSSSLTSLASSVSPVVPSTPAPAALSSLIPYASPSPPPPPPPESDPPPPLPPQPAANAGGKWKRISSVDDQKTGAVSEAPTQSAVAAAKEVPSPVSPVPSRPLKRSLDSLLEGAEDERVGGPAKKVKDLYATATAANSQPPQPATSSTSSQLSSSSSPNKLAGSSSLSNLKSSIPQPLKHPLPPKPPLPQLTGSSYRPSASGRSERTPEDSSSSSSEARLPQGRTDWPPTSPSSYCTLKGDTGAGVQKIACSSNGNYIAVTCTDRTLRILSNKKPHLELVRLAHNAPIISICWMEGDGAVLVLTGDGMLCTWTRNGKAWAYAKLQRITELAFTENDVVPQMVYAKDYIAVIIPTGVRVWRLRKGELRSERDIARSGVTAIQFVQEGKALVGGCKDGVVTSIEVHPSGQYLLISQAGGKASLVTLRPNETASVEKTYTSEKLQTLTPNRFSAVFATRGQAVLYGTVNGCALVWDRKKGIIVYGLKHPDALSTVLLWVVGWLTVICLSTDDSVQAAATFDGRAGLEGMMVTGTKRGQLFWWPQPVAAATSNSNGDESQRKRQKMGS